jgi:hypothetical protein
MALGRQVVMRAVHLRAAHIVVAHKARDEPDVRAA